MSTRFAAGLGLFALVGALLLGMALTAGAGSGGARRVVLSDGSMLVAEVLSLEAGWYTLHSSILGELRVEQERITRIERLAGDTVAGSGQAGPLPPAQAADPAVTAGSVQALQGQLLTDGASIAALLRLRESPAMQEILQDPEVMAAVRRGDFEALRSHPKMQALMEDPEMKALTGRVASQAEASD